MQVMTVLGPVPADELGHTQPHEHLLINLGWPKTRWTWEGLLNDVDLATEEMRLFREAGGRTLVEVTSWGIHRDPEGLRRIAQTVGVNIVMGCSWYREPYYDETVDRKGANEIADEIVTEIERGVGDTGIRPGIIGEVGSHKQHISAQEERVLRASARAQKRTGLALTTHSVHSPLGLAQLDILDEERVDPRRVIISHCDGYPRLDYHLAVAKRGAWVEFDNIGYALKIPQQDEWYIGLIKAMLHHGHLERVLLSQDVCWRDHLHFYGGNGYDYLLRHFVPKLAQSGVSKEQIHIMTVENPKRALAV